MKPEESSSKVDIVIERAWSSLRYTAAALGANRILGTLYGGFPTSRYLSMGIPRECLRTFPLATLWNFFRAKAKLGFLPELDEPRLTGNWVARQPHLNRVILCNGTAYRFLFPALHGKGHTLVIDRGSTHPEDFFLRPQLARKEAGYSSENLLPPSILDEIDKTKLADAILAGSQVVADSYISRGFPAERIFVAHYPVDHRSFPVQEREIPAGRPLRIGLVGLIGFRKGIYRLLKIGEWAKRRGIAVELWLVGPVGDPEVHELIAKSSATVRLFGVQKGAALLDLYRQFDLYCLPSYEEGFPGSVVEAMSTGLPAIVSSDIGSKEVIENGVNGFVLDSYSDEALDASLAAFLSDPSQFPAIGRAARLTVETRLTQEHYNTRIGEIFAQLCQAQR